MACNKCNSHSCTGTCNVTRQIISENNSIGRDGLNAYQMAVVYDGFTGTYEEWKNTLKGDGLDIEGTVPKYTDLFFIIPTPKLGDAWVVVENNLMYVYGEEGFPVIEDGIDFAIEFIPVFSNNYFTI